MYISYLKELGESIDLQSNTYFAFEVGFCEEKDVEGQQYSVSSILEYYAAK